MRRYALSLCLSAALVACGGCGKDYAPRRLLVHDATPGKVRLRIVGSPASLKKSGKIDDHRRFPMAGNVEIDTWIIKARPSEPGEPSEPGAGTARATVVLLHGLQESKASYLDLGRRLAKRGFDVVLPDLRAHGASTGKYVTYGAWERVDVKIVMDELIADKTVHPRVYVFGFSLGGSTAIQYAAIEPKKCKGVLAVAPFKDAYSIGRRFLPWIGKQEFEEALRRAGEPEMGNFNPDDASALRAAAVLACPILLVHGRLDTKVPYEHSKALFAAAKEPKKLTTVDWAGHTTLFLGREKWFAERIEELDRVARTYEKKYVTEPATAPTTRKSPGPEAPPLDAPPPKAPPLEFPPARPVASRPTTRKTPATKPDLPPPPPPPPPPPTDFRIKPFRRAETAPTTRPAALAPPAKTLSPIGPVAPKPPASTAPATRPATPEAPAAKSSL